MTTICLYSDIEDDRKKEELLSLCNTLLEDTVVEWVEDQSDAHGFLFHSNDASTHSAISSALETQRPLLFIGTAIGTAAGIGFSDNAIDLNTRAVKGVRGGDIIVEPGALIRRITDQIEGSVLGEHSVVADCSPELCAAAKNKRGEVIALQWSDISAPRSFLLGLGWDVLEAGVHSAFGGRLMRHFLLEAQAAELLLR